MQNKEDLPKSMQSLPDKVLAAVDKVTDERGNGDGWWIYLKSPFTNPDMGCNIIHEQKLSDCIAQLKSIVKRQSWKKK